MSIKINYPEIVLSLTKWKKTEYPNKILKWNVIIFNIFYYSW